MLLTGNLPISNMLPVSNNAHTENDSEPAGQNNPRPQMIAAATEGDSSSTDETLISVVGLAEGVISSSAHRISCLAQLKAGSLANRTVKPPLDVVAAVDCSSSMSEAIDLLRQTMYFVVDELRPQDRLSIVCYATDVTVCLPLRLMDGLGRAAAKAAVAGAIHARGSTNLSGGILAGLAELARREASDGPTGDAVATRAALRSAALLVMTDGTPTSGITIPDHLLAAVAGARAHQGSPPPIYAFGFGGSHDSVRVAAFLCLLGRLTACCICRAGHAAPAGRQQRRTVLLH
jgi:hypothetical protein